MDWVELLVWQLFQVVMPVLATVAFAALGLFARKYLTGKARLLYFMTEAHMEGLLTGFLNESIDFANERALQFKKDNPGTKMQKMPVAVEHVISLLANSQLPDIAEARLIDLIDREIGARRSKGALSAGMKGVV